MITAGTTQISITKKSATQILILRKSLRTSENQTIGQTIFDALLTKKRRHLSTLQCPKLMKGPPGLVSLKKLSQFFFYPTSPMYPHLIQKQQKERKIFSSRGACRSEFLGRRRIYDLVSQLLYKFFYSFARANCEKEMWVCRLSRIIFMVRSYLRGLTAKKAKPVLYALSLKNF
jgi:hypothetical protein